MSVEGSPRLTFFFYFSYLKEAATQFYFWGCSQTRGGGDKSFPRHGPLVTSVCQLTHRLSPPHSFPHFQYPFTYLILLEIEIALLKPAMVCDPVAGYFQEALNYPQIFLSLYQLGSTIVMIIYLFLTQKQKHHPYVSSPKWYMNFETSMMASRSINSMTRRL